MLAHPAGKKALRSFGFFMGGVFAIIAAILFYKGKTAVFTVFGGIAGVFFFLAMVCPSLLVGVYVRWMKFAEVVGRFNVKVILSLMYTIIFTLFRILLFVFRKNLLEKKFDPSLDSYWNDHEPIAKNLERYEKQF